MTTSRKIALIAAISSVLILLVCLRKLYDMMGPPPPAAFSRGETLAVRGLKAGERITVIKIFYPDRGEMIARNYTITGGAMRSFDAVALTPFWSRHKLRTRVDQNIGSLLLSPAQEEGLDAVLTFLRQRNEAQGFARLEYHFSFFRNEEMIGEELVLGSYLTDQLTYFAREKMRGNPSYDFDYERLAKEIGVSKETILRMETPEMLEDESRHTKL